MDKTQNLEILPTHGPRWERNRKYYLKNTHQSLRSTLLHNIKSNGIIPSEVTINQYNDRWVWAPPLFLLTPQKSLCVSVRNLSPRLN